MRCKTVGLSGSGCGGLQGVLVNRGELAWTSTGAGSRTALADLDTAHGDALAVLQTTVVVLVPLLHPRHRPPLSTAYTLPPLYATALHRRKLLGLRLMLPLLLYQHQSKIIFRARRAPEPPIP